MSDAGPPPPGGNPMFRPHDGVNPYVRPTVPAPPSPPRRSRHSRGGVPASLVLAIVLLLVGGVGFFLVKRSDTKDPGETVSSFVKAVYEKDTGAVCGAMAESNIEQFEEEDTTCKEAMDEMFADFDTQDPDSGGDPTMFFPTGDTSVPEIRILDEDIEGDRAAVSVRIDGVEGNRPLVLLKEDGRWKIDLDAGRACDRAERTLKTAAAAYEAQYGESAPDAQTLVDEGFITKVYPDAEFSNGKVTMTGDCA